jgi:hypothetical protein
MKDIKMIDENYIDEQREMLIKFVKWDEKTALYLDDEWVTIEQRVDEFLKYL